MFKTKQNKNLTLLVLIPIRSVQRPTSFDIKPKMTVESIRKEIDLDGTKMLDTMSFAIINDNLSALKIILKEKLENVTSKKRRYEIITNTRTFKTNFGHDGYALQLSSLHLAFAFAGPELCKFLIENGADHTARGKRGADALHFALMFRRLDNALLWLKTFPDYKVHSLPRSYVPPLFMCLATPGPPVLDCVDILLTIGADVFETLSFGMTLLHVLSLWNYADIKLCEKILKITVAKDPSFVNSTIEPSSLYNKQMVYAMNVLSSIGSNLTMFPRIRSAFIFYNEMLGSTPLHWAFGLGRPIVATCLIRHGADMNIRNRSGRTPLELAYHLGLGHVMQQFTNLSPEKNIREIDIDKEESVVTTTTITKKKRKAVCETNKEEDQGVEKKKRRGEDLGAT